MPPTLCEVKRVQTVNPKTSAVLSVPYPRPKKVYNVDTFSCQVILLSDQRTPWYRPAVLLGSQTLTKF